MLAGIWHEILEVDQIGRDDEFFDLGGNSLGGLRMFARIHREFGVSLPLATLLQARSLRALAAAVEAARDGIGPADGGPDSSLGMMHPQESHLATVRGGGSLPPVCAIHGGDGGILFYRELAQRLPAGRPFLAIESPDLSHSGEIIVDSVERTASDYVKMLKKSQPGGPYLLAGYSFGGVVAYEMARQLVEAGEEVPYLVLFDTVNPAVDVKEYSLPERVSVFWSAQSEKRLLGRLRSLAARFRDGVETNLRVKAEVAAAKRAEPAGAHSELRSLQLREAHYAAMQAYNPKPYPGVLTLFRADAVDDKFEVPADYGWSGIVGEIRIVDVPGEHLTLFDPKNISHLARKFADRIPGSRVVTRRPQLAGYGSP